METKELYHETRELPIPPRLPAGERRLRHRHRQRLALPLRRRPERRRPVRSVLSALPADHGRAGADDGAGRGPRQPQERGAGLSGAGKTGQQVAHPRLVLRRRLLPADDVLHHRRRLDARLLCQVPHRLLHRTGRGGHQRRVRPDAAKPRRDDRLHGAGPSSASACRRAWSASPS